MLVKNIKKKKSYEKISKYKTMGFSGSRPSYKKKKKKNFISKKYPSHKVWISVMVEEKKIIYKKRTEDN